MFWFVVCMFLLAKERCFHDTIHSLICAKKYAKNMVSVRLGLGSFLNYLRIGIGVGS